MKIGALSSGGLILGYRCSSRCRHCLYGSGPKRRDGLPSVETLDKLLDDIKTRAPYARLHIGGGEPFLDISLLEHAISGLREREIELEYVETNASWAVDRHRAKEVLARLADSGLTCVLVSLSPFHAEYVPPARTFALIEAAESVLPRGAFIWISEFVKDIAGYDPSSSIDFDALVAEKGQAYARDLGARYGLVPGGRAGRYFYHQGMHLGWKQVLKRAPCRQRLTGTSHFHIDGDGLYIPELCAGIGLPFSAVPGEIDPKEYPIVEALYQHGPMALVEMVRRLGFQPHETYSSACDLCTHLRAYLYKNGQRTYRELAPAGFYEGFALMAYELVD